MKTTQLILVLLLLASVSAKPLAYEPDEHVKYGSKNFGVPEAELEAIIDDKDIDHYWGNLKHHVLKSHLHGE